MIPEQCRYTRSLLISPLLYNRARQPPNSHFSRMTALSQSPSLFSPKTLLIYLLIMLLGGMYALVAPTLSFYLAERFSVRPLAVGGFFVAVALANIVYSQAIARRSDRLQQRHGLILAGMLLGGLACFAFAKVNHYALVLLTGLTLFSMSNAVIPQIFAFSREYADHCLPPRQTALFNSTVRACIALAWVAAPPAGFLLQRWIGFETQYLAVGTCYILIGVLAYVALPRIPKTTAATAAGYGSTTGIASTSRRSLMLMIGAFALLFGANHAYVLALPMLVSRDLGAAAEMAGWLMGTAAALEIPIMLLTGWLAARLQLLSMIRFGCAAAALLYLCVWQAEFIWQLFALQLLNAIFVGCMAGLGITLFQNRLPGKAGAASTLFTTTNQVGNILGSLLVAVFADLFGYQNLYGVNMLVAMLAFAALYWLDREPSRSTPVATTV